MILDINCLSIFQSGTLMLSQIFSEEPVVRIKCRTYELPRYVADAEKVIIVHCIDNYFAYCVLNMSTALFFKMCLYWDEEGPL